MVDILDPIVGLIVSTIGLLTAIYKIGFQTDYERENKYYKKVLKPFVDVYKKNPNLKATTILKNLIKQDNDYIPKYIYMLMQNQEENNLKKVLIYDYCELYQNEDNKLKKILKIVSKACCYILILLAILMIFLCAKYFANALIAIIDQHLNGIVVKEPYEYVKNCICGLSFIFGSFFTLYIAILFTHDRYTIKKKKIQRTIRIKIKVYDKNINNIVL